MKAEEDDECIAEHQFAEAVEGYTRAIELTPSNAVYYANRAAAHIHLENFGCALSDASRAIELDPKYTKVSTFPFAACLSASMPWRLGNPRQSLRGERILDE